MNRYFAILFLLCSVTNLFAQGNNLQKGSKSPNGLYIFNDQLNKIYPTAKINYVANSIKNSLTEDYYYQTAYIITVRTFNPLVEDLIALKSLLKEGNDVFVVSSFFNQTTYDFFNFESSMQDTIGNAIRLTSESLIYDAPITSKYLKGIKNYFTKYNKQKTTVLGTNTDGSPNFIKMKFGNGNLFIHLYPDVLTNAFILQNNNVKYTESVLSYIPKYVHRLFIKFGSAAEDDSYNGSESEGNSSTTSFMDFIKKSPNLWSAFLLGLSCLGLVILFGLKRRQNLIPVHQPIQNNTMEFAKTIGDLYFNHKNNFDIASKKIQYWQEYIRTKYQIATNTMEKEFWEKVSKKSGASTELITNLERNIIQVRNSGNVSDKLLIQLNNNIDQFYKS